MVIKLGFGPLEFVSLTNSFSEKHQKWTNIESTAQKLNEKFHRTKDWADELSLI